MICMRLSQKISLMLLVSLWAQIASAQNLPVAPAGDIQFYPVADRQFDTYTDAPSPAERQWMRDHYTRLQGWSPYFDLRLAWFPDAWFYRNAYGLSPTGNIVADNPSWVLKDGNGENLYIPFACSGGACPQFAGDFGNPDFRSWWIAEAQNNYQAGYRGIWIDDVNMTWRVSDGNGDHVTPIDPRTGSEMTLTDWRRYLVEFMEQVRAALPDAEIVHNVIWFATDRTFTNQYLARQVDAANILNLERGAADLGLVFGAGNFGFETFLSFIDFVHGRNRSVALLDETDSASLREFAHAGWFLVSNGGDLLATENQGWSAPDRWWKGYDLKLGNSVGGRYKWNGLLRRDFVCGSVFLNQPGAPTVTVSLSDTFYELSGVPRTTLTLGPRAAVALMRDCREPEAPTGISIN
jgi:hypothetical protein